MKEWTEEEVMAAPHPLALFGDAIGDRRAVKRAYTKLIRKFSPESHPEVFAHIRRLYEPVKDGQEWHARVFRFPGGDDDPEDHATDEVVVDDDDAPSTEQGAEESEPIGPVRLERRTSQGNQVPGLLGGRQSSTQTPPVGPVERLQLLMRDARHVEAAALLVEDGALRAQRPDLWIGAALHVLHNSGDQLSDELLQGLSAGADGLPFGVNPTIIRQVVDLAQVWVDVSFAQADADVDAVLVEAVRAFRLPLVAAAKEWMAVGERLGDAKTARKAMDHLLNEHPGLQVPMVLLESAFAGRSRPDNIGTRGGLAGTKEVHEGHLERLGCRLPGRKRSRNPDQDAYIRENQSVGLGIVAVMGVLLFMGTGGFAAILFWFREGLTNFVLEIMWSIFGGRGSGEKWSTLTPDYVERLCRDHVLFPQELIRMVCEDSKVEGVYKGHVWHAWGDRHPLVLVEQDRSAFLRILTPAHIDRLVARGRRLAEAGDGAGGAE